MVRHPYERVISAFRDKIEKADKLVYYNKIGRYAKVTYRQLPYAMSEGEREALIARADDLVRSHARTQDLSNPYENPLGPTFLEFSQAVLLDQKKDMHWAVYEEWCAPCYRNYSAIVRFESLNLDNLYVLRTSGLNRTGFAAHANPTSAGGTGEAVWKMYFRTLSRNLLELYRQRYSVDCELFGYDCDVSQFY